MRSIGLKLWTGMMILVMIVLLLLWLFQIVFLESFYTKLRVSEIKSTGYSIIQDIENLQNIDVKNNLDAFSYNNNLNIELIDSMGNTIYESSTRATSHMPMMGNNINYKAFKEVLKNKEVTASLMHPRFGNNFMLIGLPIMISGKVNGALLINMPLAPVKDTASLLKKQLIYITVILLFAASLISFLISKTFTKPILQIKKVSEKIASGDFTDRIDSYSKDEIGKLAETINYMGQELSKIDNLRKDLIANVSHELRTPLSLIRGYAETIKDVTGNVPDKREKQLEIIIEESDRLTNIVNDILNLSQMQSGYIELNKSRFSLNQLIHRIKKRYELLIQETEIEFIINDPQNLEILGDEHKIEQVMYNLLNNAFNHTDRYGRILVNLIDKGLMIRVEVINTGEKISDEDIKRIWDRYYKVDKTRDNKRVGTGLGLAIVKNILEAHNSLYGVESNQDIGTRFWFEIKR